MSRRTKLLLKENNELEKQIRRKENQAVLTDITVYIRSANINPYHQERARRDIWEMIAAGEKRGETAKDIIGEDYRLFCDSVIAELPHLSRKEYALSLLRDVLLSVDVLLAIWLVFRGLEQVLQGDRGFRFTVTAGNIVSAVLCIAGAFLLFHLISQNTFRIGGTSEKRTIFGLFLLLFLLMLFCMGANAFIQYTLFQLLGLVAVGGIVVLFALYKILDVKLD